MCKFFLGKKEKIFQKLSKSELEVIFPLQNSTFLESIFSQMYAGCVLARDCYHSWTSEKEFQIFLKLSLKEFKNSKIEKKTSFNPLFWQKLLHMSKKSSTFAPAFEKGVFKNEETRDLVQPG